MRKIISRLVTVGVTVVAAAVFIWAMRGPISPTTGVFSTPQQKVTIMAASLLALVAYFLLLRLLKRRPKGDV